MYSFGRDFGDDLEIDDIFREYIDLKNKNSSEGRASALPDDCIDIQLKAFEVIGSWLLPFSEAAVNAIEAVGLLNMENASNTELFRAAAKDACKAAFGFYGQLEEYKQVVRVFSARRFLVENTCITLVTVDFMYRINCI